MMSEQLERVANVSEVVGEQDAILQISVFGEGHIGIVGSVKRAGTTLTHLKTNEILDMVAMAASTAVFFATVLLVLYQRLPTFGLL
ncbi:unnamed protein product [Choristocarpus tenellus]